MTSRDGSSRLMLMLMLLLVVSGKPGGLDAVGPHALQCFKKSCTARLVICRWNAGNAAKANYTLNLRYQDPMMNKTFQAGEGTFYHFDENRVSALSNVTIWVENHADDRILASEKLLLQVSEAVTFDAPTREEFNSFKVNGTLTLKWPKPRGDCSPIQKEARIRQSEDAKWTSGNCDSEKEEDDGTTRKLVVLCHVDKNIPHEVQIRYRTSHWSSHWSAWSESILVPAEIHDSPKVTYTAEQLGRNGLRNVRLEWEKPSREQGQVEYALTFVLLPCHCTDSRNRMTVRNTTWYQIALSGAAYNISLQASNQAGSALPYAFQLPPAEQDAGLPFLHSHLSGKHLTVQWVVKTDTEAYCFEEQPLDDVLQRRSPCTEEVLPSGNIAESSASQEDPIQVRVTSETTDSAILWWEPPKALSTCPNTLKKYTICCRNEQAGNVTYYKADASETHYTILGLQPKTAYRVGVWASTDEEGSACQPLEAFLTHPPDLKQVTLALSFWFLGIFGGLLTAISIFCLGKKRAKEVLCSALPDPANTEAVKIPTLTETAQVRLKQGFIEPLESSSPSEPFLVELPSKEEPSANAKVDSLGGARAVQEFLPPKEDQVGSATLLPLEYNSQGLLNPLDEDAQGEERWRDLTELPIPFEDGMLIEERPHHSFGQRTKGHAMEQPFHPGISAPLQGHSFLRASHFQLGFDRHLEGSTVVPPNHLDYPPHWGTFLREPILPPKCAGVLNQDMGNPWETRSEYLKSYPAWPLAARPDVCPPASYLQMHADSQHHVFTSATQENYTFPSKVLPTEPHRVDKWDDSIPEGDKEKVPLPPSLYQQSYPTHQRLSSAVKAPNQHLGSDSILKGDGGVRFDSFYKSQYTGKRASPPKRFHEGLISVVFGDPRCQEVVSEYRHAYPAPHPAGLWGYDAKRAARQVFQTNIQVGDGRQCFSTNMKESFQWKEAGPAYISYPDRNMSSILQGDEGARRNKGNMNTRLVCYREPSVKDLNPQQSSSLKGRAAVLLGDWRLGSFSTTQQSDYRQPPVTHEAHSKSSDLMKSSITFSFPDTGIPTTTQDMLLSHQLQKHQIPEELLQKIKQSHLVQPWQGQQWFSTEQQEAYTDKYSGPVTLAVGGAQLSSVPLGTLKTFRR